jgi:hypothetical protein
MLIYKRVEFDDFTQDAADNGGRYWTQMCKKCVDKHGIDEKLLDNAGQGICGVAGCENESDYYVDFPEHEVEVNA